MLYCKHDSLPCSCNFVSVSSFSINELSKTFNGFEIRVKIQKMNIKRDYCVQLNIQTLHLYNINIDDTIAANRRI